MTGAAGAGSLRRVPEALRTTSRSDLAEIARIVAMFAAAEVCVRTMRLPTMARLFGVRPVGPQTTPPIDSSEFPDWARHRVRLVERVSRHWPGDGPCLRKSLVMGQRLRSLDPALHVGVNGIDGVRAHAWVSVGGRSLDAEARRFEELSWG